MLTLYSIKQNTRNKTTNQRSEQDNEISDDVFLVKICLGFFIFIQISEGEVFRQVKAE